MAALRGDLALPTTWKEVARVEKLFIYPVKSLANIMVDQIYAGVNGPSKGELVDRQFMVVDKKGKMVTARKYPYMSLIVPTVSDGKLLLTYPGMNDIEVDIMNVSSNLSLKVCDVWGEECKGVDLGNLVGEWLSDVILHLGMGLDGDYRLITANIAGYIKAVYSIYLESHN